MPTNRPWELLREEDSVQVHGVLQVPYAVNINALGRIGFHPASTSLPVSLSWRTFEVRARFKRLTYATQHYGRHTVSMRMRNVTCSVAAKPIQRIYRPSTSKETSQHKIYLPPSAQTAHPAGDTNPPRASKSHSVPAAAPAIIAAPRPLQTPT